MTIRRPDLLCDDDTVAVWLMRPNIVFTQVRSATYSLAQAKTFVGPIWTYVRRELRAPRYRWVSDSRALESYESGARLELTRWGINLGGELESVILIIKPQRKIVAMGVHVAAAAAAIAGIGVHVESSLAALPKYGLDWPGNVNDKFGTRE